MNYSAYSLPPLFADKGTVKMKLEQLTVQIILGSYNDMSSGRPYFSVQAINKEYQSENLKFEIEAYSDLTKRLIDDMVFH